MEDSLCYLDVNILTFLGEGISQHKKNEIVLYFENLKNELYILIDSLSRSNILELMPKIVGIDRKMEVLFTVIEFHKNNESFIEDSDIIKLVEEDYIKYHRDEMSKNKYYHTSNSLFYQIE